MKFQKQIFVLLILSFTVQSIAQARSVVDTSKHSQNDLRGFKHLKVNDTEYTCLNDSVYREVGQELVKAYNYDEVQLLLDSSSQNSKNLSQSIDSLIKVNKELDSLDMAVEDMLMEDLKNTQAQLQKTQIYVAIGTVTALILGFFLGY